MRPCLRRNFAVKCGLPQCNECVGLFCLSHRCAVQFLLLPRALLTFSSYAFYFSFSPWNFFGPFWWLLCAWTDMLGKTPFWLYCRILQFLFANFCSAFVPSKLYVLEHTGADPCGNWRLTRWFSSFLVASASPRIYNILSPSICLLANTLRTMKDVR